MTTGLPPPRAIGGLVLAAGAGRRAAPHDKLLARDGAGRAMIARTIAAARLSRLDRLLLVLGHEADRLRPLSAGTEIVLAGDHAEGLAASLRCGIAVAMDERWDAAMVCLGDMPLVMPAVIDRLITAFCEAPDAPDAVLPLAGGRHGNPVLWHRRMFPALLALRGDTGGRDLLRQPAIRLLTIETGDPSVLADFDTPERLALFGIQR